MDVIIDNIIHKRHIIKTHLLTNIRCKEIPITGIKHHQRYGAARERGRP